MRKYAVVLLVLLAVCLVAPAAFAQTNSAGGAAPATNWVAISAGFSMAIGAAGCGYAQGKASAAASEGFARNPGASASIQNMLILSLVLIESMALYVFAIIYLKVK
ncbi:MAG TPA: ATP synthase F0 subunit C [Candidatus Acidoferrales bacterium]|nr:ATP synthase F0 subunit C [Candidatus Acidoferrales bacterium]